MVYPSSLRAAKVQIICFVVNYCSGILQSVGGVLIQTLSQSGLEYLSSITAVDDFLQRRFTFICRRSHHA
jgi:hypothetical protein